MVKEAQSGQAPWTAEARGEEKLPGARQQEGGGGQGATLGKAPESLLRGGRPSPTRSPRGREQIYGKAWLSVVLPKHASSRSCCGASPL